MYSRYGIDGQLTVTKLSSGDTAVTNVRGDSTIHNTLTLNTPIYVAGLPNSYSVGTSIMSLKPIVHPV